MPGPLSGITVLELGSFIAGPFAGQLLADYGAEVIKVEPPDAGDPMRRWGVTVDGDSLWWPAIARNKRSVTIDLRSAEGQDLVRRIAPRVDVVLENFRPGTIERWGLGMERLQELNPGIVVVHVSGFGRSGPLADQPGFGSVGEAVGGIRYTTGSPDQVPARCGVSLGDSLAGMFAVIGALASLVERSRSGRGQEVDVAISEAVLALMESTLADYHVAGVVRKRTGGTLEGVAPSNVYPTGDGLDIIVAANADTVFARLARAIGKPELPQDPRFRDHEARGRNMAALDDLIAAWTGRHTAEQVIKTLRAHGVPVGPINNAETLIEDEQFRARDMVLWHTDEAGRELPMNGIVPKFSRTPGAVDRLGPALGADTDAVLLAHGVVDSSELDRLRAAGVV